MSRPSEAFEDDSSRFLGLNHRPSVRSASEAESDRIRCDERYRRVVEPLAEEERKRLLGSGIRDITSVIPTNAGAHDDIDHRTRELTAAGYSLSDATRIAIEEAELVPEGEPMMGKQKPKDDYLGASVSDLMAHPIAKHGSSSKGRRRTKPRPLTGEERMARRTMFGGAFDEGHTQGNRVGRPLDGLQVREVVTLRAEPRDVQALRDGGSSAAEAVEVMADCMRMVQRGDALEAVTTYFLGMITELEGEAEQ